MDFQAYADRSSMPASEATRVAILLGMDRPREVSDVQLALTVSKGLRARSARALAKLLGTNRIVGPVIPEATLRRARRARKSLSREHSERLYEVGRVVDAVSCAFHGDRNAIEAFLNRPHPMLEGSTPFDLARSSSAGADAVVSLVRRAEAGMAV